MTVALTFTLWLTAVFGGYYYFTALRQLESIAVADVILPARWENIRGALGDRLILDARQALQAKEIQRALLLYRGGIARAPRHISGRIETAQLYVAMRRPDLAKDVLIDGVPHLAGHADYLQRTLGFLLEFQFDPQLQALCARLLRDPSRQTRLIAAYHAAALSLQRGNYDGAEALILTHQLDGSPEGVLLLARADLERGFPDLALTRLESLTGSGVANSAALALAAEIHQHTGHATETRLHSALRISADPLNFQPRLARLQLLATENNPGVLAAEIDNYLQLFAREQPALLALADFAANTGQPGLTRRIQAVFQQHRWPDGSLSLLYAESCIHARRYADGLAELDRYLHDNPQWATRYGPAFDGLRTVALYGLNRDDEAKLQLEHLLGQPNLRAENLLVLSQRLLALGHPEAAHLALSRIAELDPKNQAALAALVRLEAEHGHLDTLPAHLAKFLAVRRPAREVLALAYRRIGSDLNLFQPDQQKLLAELRQRLGRDTAPPPRS